MDQDAFVADVASVVERARLFFGEPEYVYYKKQVTWSPKSRSFFVAVSPNRREPITREEYEANVAQAKSNELDRFMGRLKKSYYRYEREQVAPAWREKLLELIPNYPA